MGQYENDELMYYGIKGMKWGVRKDARLLANHTRNQAVKDAKKQYKSGTISKDQRKAAITKANTTLKGSKKSTKSAYKATKTRGERTQYKYEKTVRKGAKWVNQMEREFSNTNIKMSKTQIDKGKQYIDIINEREKTRIDRVY